MAGWVTIDYRSGSERKEYVAEVAIFHSAILVGGKYLIPLDIIYGVTLGDGVTVREGLKEE